MENKKKTSDCEDLYVVGASTIDDDGFTGTISEIEDMHNVMVDLDSGGKASYCCVPLCDDYFPCKIIVNEEVQSELDWWMESVKDFESAIKEKEFYLKYLNELYYDQRMARLDFKLSPQLVDENTRKVNEVETEIVAVSHDLAMIEMVIKKMQEKNMQGSDQTA